MLLDQAAGIASEAQKNLLTLEVETKKDSSPVSRIDKELSELFVSSLPKILPKSVVVSEECAVPQLSKGTDPVFMWFVDPIDATKEYIRGGDEWAVQLALYQGSVPKAIWVWVPKMGQRFFASTETPLPRSLSSPPAQVTALFSRSRDDQWAAKVCARLGVEGKLQRSSMGYKGVSIALGEADFYVNAGGFCGPWDLAPCQLPLEQAGGQIVLAARRPFEIQKYLLGDGIIQEPFAFVGPRLMHRCDEISKLLESV